MKYVRSWLCAVGALVLMLSLVFANGARVVAQEEEATPPPEEVTVADIVLPVAIHPGTCEEPTAEPEFDISEARLFGRDDDDDDDDNDEMRGAAEAVPVLMAQETIDIPFNELLDEAGPHVVAVHESSEAFGTFVACGAIGGIDEDGRLVIGLLPVNDSNVAGIAILDEDDAGFLGLGDDEVQVTVYVIPDLTAAPEAVATPVPENDEEEENDE